MSGMYDASMKRVHRMAKALEQREAGGVREMNIERVKMDDLHDDMWLRQATSPEYAETLLPVVRLSEVDAVLEEAVWAMELLQCMPPHRFADASLNRIQAFLDSPLVAAWRERQKGKL